jgi:signal transduction histidine kinase
MPGQSTTQSAGSGDPWSHRPGDGLHLDLRIGVVKGCLRVELEDDGAGSAGVSRAPGGGPTGMAERVGAYGGELTCGTRQPRR